MKVIAEGHFDEWKAAILNLRQLINSVECPAAFLDELGYEVVAGILPGDSDDTKRKKIAGAIESHKYRGTFKFDVKKRIDAITGYDAELYTVTSTGAWILTGDGTEDPTLYYGTLGADGIDAGYGLDLLGAGDEIEIPGNIFIDVHYGVNTGVLTPDIITSILTDISDSVPAYMHVYLGYVDGSGNFVIYAADDQMNYMLTEAGDYLLTEAGDYLMT